MKIAIVGSKSIFDEEVVVDFIEKNHKFKPNDIIISGGVTGVDSIAEKYAKDHSIKTKIYKPNWSKYGENADFIRNADIISSADLCIIIWDGYSLCTANDITLCEEMNKPIKLLKIDR